MCGTHLSMSLPCQQLAGVASPWSLDISPHSPPSNACCCPLAVQCAGRAHRQLVHALAHHRQHPHGKQHGILSACPSCVGKPVPLCLPALARPKPAPHAPQSSPTCTPMQASRAELEAEQGEFVKRIKERMVEGKA